MKEPLFRHIAEKTGMKPGTNARAVPLSGGSINHAFRLSFGNQNYFVKTNQAQKFPGMFEHEARGLRLLAATNTLRVPEIIASGEFNDESYLILEFLERGIMQKNYWEEAGTNLARMHKHSHDKFGLDHDNYMGSLPQKNAYKKSYVEFFIDNRLQPQFEMAAARHSAIRSVQEHFESLYKRLPQLIPDEKPALVHGDLWSGNMIIGPEGQPCIIDPATNYGHREADIAMTRLFGGFAEEFYDAYHAAFPLTPGWKDRVDLFNLYPLLVHVNLFGGGYVQSVATLVRRFS